jgi:murein DD-endopeptidase MepM/ murein hydrolase activator NlpD
VAARLGGGRGGGTPSRRGLILGGAGAGALAAVGLGWSLTRPIKRPAPPGAEAAPVQDPAVRTYEAQDIEGPASLEARLSAYGIRPDQARSATAALARALGGRSGRMRLTLGIAAAEAGRPRLDWLEVRRVADGLGWRLDRRAGDYAATALAAALAPRLVAHSRLQINRDGLYASAVGDLDPTLLTAFAEAMAFDFDFAEEVREGDQFEVVHEEMRDAEGGVVGRPRLLFAFMSAGGKDRYLYRFKPTGGEEGWYDDRGRSTKRAFMRTPLDGARITSLFGPRVHPVFHSVRLHKGLDFGCKIGTHVFAAADGEVTYAGPASGFGVLLKISHAGGLETWYGHLSGFPDDVRPGVQVAQGRLVAYSGNVGVSSGPHLHYETHKDGVAVDPKIFLDAQEALGGAPTTLQGDVLARFLTFKDEIDEVRRAQA